MTNARRNRQATATSSVSEGGRWSSVWKSVERVAFAVTLVAGVSCALASVLGFLGSWWWRFDLLAHFRVQYLWGLVLAVGALAALRRWRWLYGGAGFVLLNGLTIMPLYCSSAAASDPETQRLRMVSFNVNFTNTDHDSLIEYLQQQDVDVMVVLEVRQPLLRALEQAFGDWHVIGQPSQDAFGMAVLTRQPIVRHEIVALADSPPGIWIELDHGGHRYHVLAIHTLPPMSSEATRLRDDALDLVARWSKQRDGHIVVIGDFNATPWSHAFRRLLDDADLVNSQLGYGVQSTWPRRLWPLSIPIDHCVHSDSLTTTARDVGPFLGSDHRPLLGDRGTATERLVGGVTAVALDARAFPGAFTGRALDDLENVALGRVGQTATASGRSVGVDAAHARVLACLRVPRQRQSFATDIEK